MADFWSLGDPNRLKQVVTTWEIFSSPNAYVIIVILILGAKVMAVLSFTKDKFPKFLSLSNTVTPSAPGIFHTKYGSKETTTQKISQK